jgi:hypothetical protein
MDLVQGAIAGDQEIYVPQSSQASESSNNQAPLPELKYKKKGFIRLMSTKT